MQPSSRTPEGWPTRCPTCGHAVTIEPSTPLYDATCPCCGALLWLAPRAGRLQATTILLAAGVATVVAASIVLIFVLGGPIYHGLGWPEFIVLAVIGILLFGRRLPNLARWIGARLIGRL